MSCCSYSLLYGCIFLSRLCSNDVQSNMHVKQLYVRAIAIEHTRCARENVSQYEIRVHFYMFYLHLSSVFLRKYNFRLTCAIPSCSRIFNNKIRRHHHRCQHPVQRIERKKQRIPRNHLNNYNAKQFAVSVSGHVLEKCAVVEDSGSFDDLGLQVRGPQYQIE